MIQDADKSFEAIIALKSLTILLNSHKLQRHACTKKHTPSSKEKGMHKDIDNFFQNCYICRQHNLQEHLYS